MPTTTSHSHVSALTSASAHEKRNATKPSALLMLTCIGALDGTIMLLAATGRLASIQAALLVGLTIVSGTGAWITARGVFADGVAARDYLSLARIAAISIAATVAAAWLGLSIGQAVTLHIMPKVAGIVLVLIAAEIGGLKMPRLSWAPLPVLVAVGGIVLEGALYWIPG